LKNKNTITSSTLNLEYPLNNNNNKNSYALNHLKKSAEYIDLKVLSEDKSLEETQSPLEFFIISLSKSLDLKPRQAAALLSNSRKYLIQISNRGIKGDYSKIISWYQDLFSNYKKLMQIINKSQMKDAKSMTFATLSVGLYSKNNDLARNAYSMLMQLEADLGIDYDWFFKDGLDVLYFCISKHAEMRYSIISFLEKLTKENPEKMHSELFSIRKLGSHKIYEFISNIMDEISNCSYEFLSFLKFRIPEFCFIEKFDLPLACAILIDWWIKLNLSNDTSGNRNKQNSEAENNLTNNIIKFLRNAVRDRSQRNLQVTAVTQMFRLLKILGEEKDENAPIIYKSLVFLFLENYDDSSIREVFLQNFSFIFNADQSIPIDIFLDPYISQLKGNNNVNNINVINIPTNYDINDFKFLKEIIAHPKIKLCNLKEILEFSTLVSYTNLFYARSANLIINTILDKNLNSYNDLLNSKNLNQDIIDIYDVCISYIKNALKIFLQNTKDLMILETPYDIANLNINYILKNIEKVLIEANETYRKEKGFFSSGLLALLWFYDKHDDVLLMLEEKYTEKFKKNETSSSIVSSSKTGLEKRKANFLQGGKPLEFLKILKLKREKTLKEKEEKDLEHARKEAKKLPESLQKLIMIASSALKNNPQRNSLFKSMDIKSLLEVGKENKNLILIDEKIRNSSLSPKKLLGQQQKGNYFATLIQPEGAKAPFNSSNDHLFGKNLSVFYDYEVEGEEREKTAIDALLKQYARNLKQFFSFYVTEVNNTIVKHNLMKMFREIGIDGESLNLDQLNSIMRSCFKVSLNNITKEQFDKLLIQLSYVIYTKIKPNHSISMCFKEILRIISYWCNHNKINAISSDSNFSSGSRNAKSSFNFSHPGAYNKKMFEYLKSKVEGHADILNKNYIDVTEEAAVAVGNNSLIPDVNTNQSVENSIILGDNNVLLLQKEKNNNEKKDILIPPGYKKAIQTKIEYEYSIPRDFALSFLSEAQVICYEIINDIIQKKFSSGIVEPYVKVYNELKLFEEPLEPKRRWGNKLTLAYTKLDKQYEKIGKECADVLEDILRAVSLGRDSIDKPKYLTDKEKAIQEEKELKEKEKLDSEKVLKERKREIATRLKKLKNEKNLEEKQKFEEEDKQKKHKQERMKELTKNIEQKRMQMKQDVEKSKKEKEKNREEKEKYDKAKKDKEKLEKEQKKKDFFKKQRRKLKEQFKEIKTENNNYLKQQQELINIKLPEINMQKIIDKDKQYVEFEKNLNDKIEEMLSRSDLKEFLGIYESHFKHIYDFYSKLGNTKIKLNHEEAIHFSEYKEFCVNFMIFGLLLSADQVNYIFKKICRRNEGKGEDMIYLKYNDFMISLVYVALFLKISRKGSNRILPSDLEKIDITSLKNIVDFMNLKLPYNKRQLEDFINDRRALSAKELIRLQNQTKKDNSDFVRSSTITKGEGNRNIISQIKQKEKENKEKIDQLDQMRLKEKEDLEAKKLEEEELAKEEINKKPNQNAKKEADAVDNKNKPVLKPNLDKNPNFSKNNKGAGKK